MNLQPSRDSHDKVLLEVASKLGIDKIVDREYKRQLKRQERKQARSVRRDLEEYKSLVMDYILTLVWIFDVGKYTRACDENGIENEPRHKK